MTTTALNLCLKNNCTRYVEVSQREKEMFNKGTYLSRFLQEISKAIQMTKRRNPVAPPNAYTSGLYTVENNILVKEKLAKTCI